MEQFDQKMGSNKLIEFLEQPFFYLLLGALQHAALVPQALQNAAARPQHVVHLPVRRLPGKSVQVKIIYWNMHNNTSYNTKNTKYDKVQTYIYTYISSPYIN